MKSISIPYQKSLQKYHLQWWRYRRRSQDPKGRCAGDNPRSQQWGMDRNGQWRQLMMCSEKMSCWYREGGYLTNVNQHLHEARWSQCVLPSENIGKSMVFWRYVSCHDSRWLIVQIDTHRFQADEIQPGGKNHPADHYVHGSPQMRISM